MAATGLRWLEVEVGEEGRARRGRANGCGSPPTGLPKRWDHVVPEVHIVGGGGPTKADAARRAAEAIASPSTIVARARRTSEYLPSASADASPGGGPGRRGGR